MELRFFDDIKPSRAWGLIRVLIAGLTSELSFELCGLDTNRHNQIAATELITLTKKNITNSSIFLSPKMHPCNLQSPDSSILNEYENYYTHFD